MFAAQLLTLALLFTGAISVPSSRSRMGDRLARRAERSHTSLPLQPVDDVVNTEVVDAAISNTTHVAYSTNWAGAVWRSAYPAGTFKSVAGTFTVPTPKKGAGSATSYSVSAWVGIDGDSCGTAILQTGLDFTVTANNKVSYDAWYEWYPDYAYDFSGITFKAGNVVTLTVIATSPKSGTAIVKNVSTGKSVSKTLTSTVALCQKNAEWIVEDYQHESSLVPFANFGAVKFTNAVATSKSGLIGPTGATVVDIKQGGTVRTSSSVSGNSVHVKFLR